MNQAAPIRAIRFPSTLVMSFHLGNRRLDLLGDIYDVVGLDVGTDWQSNRTFADAGRNGERVVTKTVLLAVIGHMGNGSRIIDAAADASFAQRFHHVEP